MTHTLLGRDGCGSDEIMTEYLLRDGQLVERCTYDSRERPADPTAAVAELGVRAAVSRDMAETCARQGIPASDYLARERACADAARKIRAAFGLAE